MPKQQAALTNKRKALNSAIKKENQRYLSENDWSKSALLIIDMQEAYREEIIRARIIPQIEKLVQKCRENIIPIF